MGNWRWTVSFGRRFGLGHQSKGTNHTRRLHSQLKNSIAICSRWLFAHFASSCQYITIKINYAKDMIDSLVMCGADGMFWLNWMSNEMNQLYFPQQFCKALHEWHECKNGHTLITLMTTIMMMMMMICRFGSNKRVSLYFAPATRQKPTVLLQSSCSDAH